MKRRKTRVQKIEQKAKVASNLLIAQSKFTAVLQLQVDKLTEELEKVKTTHGKHIFNIGNTVMTLRGKFNNLDHDLGVLTEILDKHKDRIVALEDRSCIHARLLELLNALDDCNENWLGVLQERIAALESKGFWAKLISRLLGKKVRHAL